MNAETKVKAAGPHVYQAIAEVQGELAKTGIAKNRKNSQGSGYMFRGIDDVYAALSPLLAAHKLVVVPRVTQRECVERQSKNGGLLFYVTVHAEFDFISAIDGTTHTVEGNTTASLALALTAAALKAIHTQRDGDQ